MATKSCRRFLAGSRACALQRKLAAEAYENLALTMHFPIAWDPYFHDTMSVFDVYRARPATAGLGNALPSSYFFPADHASHRWFRLRAAPVILAWIFEAGGNQSS
jgi:hypothetical protein